MKKILALLALVPGTAFAQQIAVDGSSTVYPISLAMAEEFQIVNPDAQITVGFAGTGGGFERFCAGETQISDASRVIEEDEVAACEAAGISFIEQGVQGNANAMGFFGYAYYAENPDTLKAVEIDGGDGCVAPSAETVEDASYTPLSRPLFIYVSQSAVDSTPAVQDFVDFYLSPDNRELIEDTGYVTYDESIYEAVQARFDERVTGSAFADFAPGDDVLGAVQEAEQ